MAGPKARLAAWLALSVAPCSGCSSLLEVAERKIEERAREAAPGAVPGQAPEPTVTPRIVVNSVRPSRGETSGGTSVP